MTTNLNEVIFSVSFSLEDVKNYLEKGGFKVTNEILERFIKEVSGDILRPEEVDAGDWCDVIMSHHQVDFQDVYDYHAVCKVCDERFFVGENLTDASADLRPSVNGKKIDCCIDCYYKETKEKLW